MVYDEDSVSVLVRTLDFVENNVKVVKLSSVSSWTGITLIAEVFTIKDAVAGGVLPPSQSVEPSSLIKEYGP